MDINFNELTDDIKNLIFMKNREEALKISKELEDFWNEWCEMYEDDLEEAYMECDECSSPNWDNLTKKEKLKIYEAHNINSSRHLDILECGYSDIEQHYPFK